MSSTTPKPAILLVHGAWHRPAHYIKLVEALQNKSYDVRTPALATAGWNKAVSQASISDDVIIIRKVLAEHFEAGREVIVISHSYGGIPCTDAVVGETIADRRSRGQVGGVKAVIYIAAFAPPAAGMSLSNLTRMEDASQHPSWWTPKDDLAYLEDEARGLMYSGVQGDVAQMSFDTTVPQSLISFADPCAQGSSEVLARKVYVICREDSAVPYQGQRAMAEAAGAEMIEIESGHSPFLQSEVMSKLVEAVEGVV
ncbi:putative hydrolase R7 [Paramyrothecium foliicola]|nr:putative hydrolase R7 [Paramyrothecium foliicola]